MFRISDFEIRICHAEMDTPLAGAAIVRSPLLLLTTAFAVYAGCVWPRRPSRRVRQTLRRRANGLWAGCKRGGSATSCPLLGRSRRGTRGHPPSPDTLTTSDEATAQPSHDPSSPETLPDKSLDIEKLPPPNATPDVADAAVAEDLLLSEVESSDLQYFPLSPAFASRTVAAGTELSGPW